MRVLNTRLEVWHTAQGHHYRVVALVVPASGVTGTQVVASGNAPARVMTVPQFIAHAERHHASLAQFYRNREDAHG